MIKDRLIVCIASAWDYDPTSKHHVMKLLAEQNDILWVNYHGSRSPAVSRSDLRHTIASLQRVASGLRRVSDSITQLTPLVIPGAKNPLVRALHRRILIAQIRRAIRAVQSDTPRPVQVWCFAPDVPYLVGALGEECFLYYCVDEYRKFEGFDAQRIATDEDELVANADVVVTTSEPLLEAKREQRSDAVLVRHGVDYDHFAAAQQKTLARPDDLNSISGPIFGFFGLVHNWVDCELLAKVAKLRPLYSFVVIGDCKVDVSMLEKLDNVHLLGRKSYEELPNYCAHFAAGLLLFRQTDMTRHVNPIKMYEYLAAGLPIVSTSLPEARRFADAITIADSPEEFAGACDRVTDDRPSDRATRSHLVKTETWRAKVEYLCDIIEGKKGMIVQEASRPTSDLLVKPTAQRPSAAAIR